MKEGLPDSAPSKIDEESFVLMYRMHWEKLYSLSVYRLGDADLAKEIVQEVFCSIWERREVLCIEGPVEHYLLRAVKLKIVEHFRTAQIHERRLTDFAHGLRRAEDTTENQVVLNDLRMQIQHFVETLPRQCRRVYELSRSEGMNTREIALEMVISEKTVKNHLTKALSSIKSILD